MNTDSGYDLMSEKICDTTYWSNPKPKKPIDANKAFRIGLALCLVLGWLILELIK